MNTLRPHPNRFSQFVQQRYTALQGDLAMAWEDRKRQNLNEYDQALIVSTFYDIIDPRHRFLLEAFVECSMSSRRTMLSVAIDSMTMEWEAFNRKHKIL